MDCNFASDMISRGMRLLGQASSTVINAVNSSSPSLWIRDVTQTHHALLSVSCPFLLPASEALNWESLALRNCRSSFQLGLRCEFALFLSSLEVLRRGFSRSRKISCRFWVVFVGFSVVVMEEVEGIRVRALNASPCACFLCRCESCCVGSV